MVTPAQFAVSDFTSAPNRSGVLPFGQALERRKIEIAVFSQIAHRYPRGRQARYIVDCIPVIYTSREFCQVSKAGANLRATPRILDGSPPARDSKAQSGEEYLPEGDPYPGDRPLPAVF